MLRSECSQGNFSISDEIPWSGKEVFLNTGKGGEEHMAAESKMQDVAKSTSIISYYYLLHCIYKTHTKIGKDTQLKKKI